MSGLVLMKLFTLNVLEQQQCDGGGVGIYHPVLYRIDFLIRPNSRRSVGGGDGKFLARFNSFLVHIIALYDFRVINRAFPIVKRTFSCREKDVAAKGVVLKRAWPVRDTPSLW